VALLGAERISRGEPFVRPAAVASRPSEEFGDLTEEWPVTEAVARARTDVKIIGHTRMEYVEGYFTVERNIVGSSLDQIESKLGLRRGRLLRGARVLVLLRQPSIGQFVFAGSTLYSDAKGLVQERQRGNVPIPGAWLGQRLVKVVPNLPHSHSEWYPKAQSPVEQWKLLVPVAAEEVCRLNANQVYWRRR
jgi:hypothetical protein